MCGRFVDPDLRSEGLDTSWLKIVPFQRRYNVKPTQEVLTCTATSAEMARWWLVPGWHKGDLREWRASTFNARLEDAARKPSFRAAWRSGRCLIPAGAYYEWTGEKGARIPHAIVSASNEATLWMAGLTSRWRDVLTCTILTREANDAVAAVHDRMPVILDTAEREAWLGGPAGGHRAARREQAGQAGASQHPGRTAGSGEGAEARRVGAARERVDAGRKRQPRRLTARTNQTAGGSYRSRRPSG